MVDKEKKEETVTEEIEHGVEEDGKGEDEDE